MTIILSLSHSAGILWASGPEGLYRLEGQELQLIAQPQIHLYSSLAAGERVLVGGEPHSVAYSLDQGQNWQTAWLDGLTVPILCFAAQPTFAQTGVILAGSQGAGILRSNDGGRHWTVCNFGLQDYTVLSLAWIPPAVATVWPQWDIVFAATENGLYRSPNGGLGWRRCEADEGCFQTLATAHDFHHSGLVLAGSEDIGLWRSSNKGYRFEAVPDAPQEINALAATTTGWLLSDTAGLWQSSDGLAWTPLANSQPALAFLPTSQGVWAGGENGLTLISPINS